MRDALVTSWPGRSSISSKISSPISNLKV